MGENFTALGKYLIIFGVVIVLVGIIIYAIPKIPFLGKLPGDIYIKKEGFSFYMPITTSIVLSILLSLILSLFRK